ncbi:hypothetical protein HAX54_002118 [Datura stramonium]|uniref:Uncharacterized protein n=1 Tax=Datura stramonium TaxID=4076 RepID=A0ABS8T4J3_DATST|nr:hypothetical protein [Datura stramonium]
MELRSLAKVLIGSLCDLSKEKYALNKSLDKFEIEKVMLVASLNDLKEKYRRLSGENLTLNERMSEMSQNGDNRTNEIQEVQAEVDLNASLAEDTPVNTSADKAALISQYESVLSSDISSPSSTSYNDKEVVTKKGTMETSYDYLFKGELPMRKGTYSNILAHGDQLIVQSLTQMEMGDEHPPSNERTVSRSPSHAPTSPVLTSAPKWDGTLGDLSLQQNVENSDDVSEDNHPLAWKVRKIQQGSSRDQVLPPVTRSNSKKLLEDSLKESQKMTARRRKLKRKMVVEGEMTVQPENIFDHEEVEGEKESEEELLVRVKKGKMVSQPTSGKRTRLPK